MQWFSDAAIFDGPAILVTVASVEGSAPREPGAKMLVLRTGECDTVGGGHLELCAIRFARDMLTLPHDDIHGHRRLERFPLGPTLGQCCGGVVYLAFERIDAAASEFLSVLRRRWQQGLDSWRLIALDAPAAPILLDENGHRIAGHEQPLHGQLVAPVLESIYADFQPDRIGACRLVRDKDGGRWLLDPCRPCHSHLFLFGAGHVGAALVRALADVPCRVTWVDERADRFPAALPFNVTAEITDVPEAAIDAASPGASFLVMTHSHALDLRLAERVLLRDDVAWFGLIGSRTKRIQFERRLRARGMPEQRIAAMVCPIGIAGIGAKAPAMIAISVAAQLLQVWELQQAAALEQQDLQSVHK